MLTYFPMCVKYCLVSFFCFKEQNVAEITEVFY